jgi:hypothetical protein
VNDTLTRATTIKVGLLLKRNFMIRRRFLLLALGIYLLVGIGGAMFWLSQPPPPTVFPAPPEIAALKAREERRLAEAAAKAAAERKLEQARQQEACRKRLTDRVKVIEADIEYAQHIIARPVPRDPDAAEDKTAALERNNAENVLRTLKQTRDQIRDNLDAAK